MSAKKVLKVSGKKCAINKSKMVSYHNINALYKKSHNSEES